MNNLNFLCFIFWWHFKFFHWWSLFFLIGGYIFFWLVSVAFGAFMVTSLDFFSWNNLFIYLFYFFINIKNLWTMLNIMKNIQFRMPQKGVFWYWCWKLTFTNNFGFIIVIWNSLHLMSNLPLHKTNYEIQ